MIDSEKWMHKKKSASGHQICRSPKDGLPQFDGKRWYCSQCENGYYVNMNGCSQEEADVHFSKFMANVCFESRIA